MITTFLISVNYASIPQVLAILPPVETYHKNIFSGPLKSFTSYWAKRSVGKQLKGVSISKERF